MVLVLEDEHGQGNSNRHRIRPKEALSVQGFDVRYVFCLGQCLVKVNSENENHSSYF